MKIKIEVFIDSENPAEVIAANVFLNALAEAFTPAEKPVKKAAKKAPPVGIKIEDIRSTLAKKVSDHRTDIKAELTRLEANNVTSLAPEKYQEFMDFLNGLK